MKSFGDGRRSWSPINPTLYRGGRYKLMPDTRPIETKIRADSTQAVGSQVVLGGKQ